MSEPCNTSLTRRDVVRISLGTVSAAWIAGCSRTPLVSAAAPTAGARGAFFSEVEMAQLAEVVEIIIPTTDTPGARAANVHGFIDNLMAEGAVATTQNTVRALLTDIDTRARRQFGKTFLAISPEQRSELITAVDAEAFRPADSASAVVLPHPFVRLKEWTFLGYYQSEIGATRELQYNLVPGHYESCAALSAIGRAWAAGWGVLMAQQQILSECDCASGDSR